jgi:hypothetical protein
MLVSDPVFGSKIILPLFYLSVELEVDMVS